MRLSCGVGWGVTGRVRGDVKNMPFGGPHGIHSSFQGHSPGGATV